MTFAASVRRLRLQAALSQSESARRAGTTQQRISLLERPELERFYLSCLAQAAEA